MSKDTTLSPSAEELLKTARESGLSPSQLRKHIELAGQKGLSGNQFTDFLQHPAYPSVLEAAKRGTLKGADMTVLRHILGLPPLVKGGEKTAEGVYLVTVNYDQSVEDAVRAGCYDWTNSDINSDHFTTSRKGKADVAVELVHFNRSISTDAALRELDEKGYCPAELHELLALGESYPELQRDFPIIALGFLWRCRGGDRYAPYLSRLGSERDLHLYWAGGDWDEVCRFAAVRK